MAVAASSAKPASDEELIVGPPYHAECWTLAGHEVLFIDRPLNGQPLLSEPITLLRAERDCSCH